MIVIAPAEIPLTVPEEEPMEAIAVLLLVQVPPPTVLVRVVVPPTHTLVLMGTMAVGVLATVIVLRAEQPELLV